MSKCGILCFKHFIDLGEKGRVAKEEEMVSEKPAKRTSLEESLIRRFQALSEMNILLSWI
jgi:hypothetical protein